MYVYLNLIQYNNSSRLNKKIIIIIIDETHTLETPYILFNLHICTYIRKNIGREENENLHENDTMRKLHIRRFHSTLCVENIKEISIAIWECSDQQNDRFEANHGYCQYRKTYPPYLPDITYSYTHDAYYYMRKYTRKHTHTRVQILFGLRYAAT